MVYDLPSTVNEDDRDEGSIIIEIHGLLLQLEEPDVKNREELEARCERLLARLSKDAADEALWMA